MVRNSIVAVVTALIWAMACRNPCPAEGEPAPTYSAVWKPIDRNGIEAGVLANSNDGIALQSLMMRAMLQQKGNDYLAAIQKAVELQPDNATLLAVHAWALSETRASYEKSSQAIPEGLKKRFNLEPGHIREEIQAARKMDPKCWVADLAEASLSYGGLVGTPTRAAALCEHALSLNENALTLTRCGAELLFQGASLRDVEMQQRALGLLLKARTLHPDYYAVNLEIYWAYQYPRIADKEKSLEAFRFFIETIPPEDRESPWVRRYLTFLRIDPQLWQSKKPN